MVKLVKDIKIRKNLKSKDLPSIMDGDDVIGQYPWSAKDLLFIATYRDTLDIQEAQEAACMSNCELKRCLKDKKMVEAIEDAKKDYLEAMKLHPKRGARKFMEVFEKLEKQFDAGELKVAAPLANMATNFLRATGQLNNGNGSGPRNITVNIDMGGKNISISGADKSGKDLVSGINNNLISEAT